MVSAFVGGFGVAVATHCGSLVVLVECVEVVDDVVVGGVPCVAFLEAFAFYFA